MKSKYISDKQARRNIRISRNELKQLIHWASYGVNKARGGSYWKEIVPTLLEFSEKCGNHLFQRPHFIKPTQAGE